MRNKEIQRTTIFDRCIYEDYLVFAKTIKRLNYIDQNEMSKYEYVYGDLIKDIRQPDLVIYLDATVDTLK